MGVVVAHRRPRAARALRIGRRILAALVLAAALAVTDLDRDAPCLTGQASGSRTVKCPPGPGAARIEPPAASASRRASARPRPARPVVPARARCGRRAGRCARGRPRATPAPSSSTSITAFVPSLATVTMTDEAAWRQPFSITRREDALDDLGVGAEADRDARSVHARLIPCVPARGRVASTACSIASRASEVPRIAAPSKRATATRASIVRAICAGAAPDRCERVALLLGACAPGAARVPPRRGSARAACAARATSRTRSAVRCGGCCRGA